MNDSKTAQKNMIILIKVTALKLTDHFKLNATNKTSNLYVENTESIQ